MKTKDTIPMYDMQDINGNPIDFDVLIWGKKDQAYDVELPHRHTFYEVLFFDEGGGTHDIDFITFPAQNKSIHFVASNNVHLVLRDTKVSHGCSLLFSENYFAQNQTTFNPLKELPFSTKMPVLILSDIDFEETVQLIEKIKLEYFAKADGFERIVYHYMILLMLNWHREYKKQYPNENAKNKLSPIIEKFLKYAEESYKKHYTIQHYASQIGITASHLTETCHKETGKTASHILHEHITSEAKKLLYHTNQSVKEIAFTFGYSDPAHFTRFFKNKTGYSPTDYRNGILH